MINEQVKLSVGLTVGKPNPEDNSGKGAVDKLVAADQRMKEHEARKAELHAVEMLKRDIRDICEKEGLDAFQRIQQIYVRVK